jgi:hypothetical protein
MLSEVDPLPVANDMKVLQLEMEVGNRQLPEAAGERLLFNVGDQ